MVQYIAWLGARSTEAYSNEGEQQASAHSMGLLQIGKVLGFENSRNIDYPDNQLLVVRKVRESKLARECSTKNISYYMYI